MKLYDYDYVLRDEREREYYLGKKNSIKECAKDQSSDPLMWDCGIEETSVRIVVKYSIAFDIIIDNPFNLLSLLIIINNF